MAEHVEVFISATSSDLGSYRKEIKEALLTLQIFPIEQSNFALAYGPLTALLRELIGRCEAAIHLAGFHYGAEPPQRAPGAGRRSYTQIEYDVARELGKPIYLFLAAENCEPDKRLAQSEEEKELQLAHRRAIENCGDVYYPFASHQEVGSRVRELRYPARSAAVPRRVVNLPYNSLGPLFKGRDAVLGELRQRLGAGEGRAVGHTAPQAIHGLGGVGKTRLAIEYAWRHAGKHNALLFASARSAADLRTNLAVFCDPLVLDLPEQARPEEAARLAAVFRWLSEHHGWLLILDSADTDEAASEVEKTLPKLQSGQVIITSRIADWSPAVHTAELDVLAEEDATAFLLERTESKRRETPTDSQESAALARELGGLALALEQVGAYIAKNRLSFSEYRHRLESAKAEALAWYDARLMAYPSSVAVTWQTTIDQLSPPDRKLLNMLAWLAPEPLPVSLLEGVPLDGRDGRDALARLASWSLVRWTADGEGFTVHRLVQEITRQHLSDNEKDDTLGSALALLDARLPSPEWDVKGWKLWEQLASHCWTLLDRLRNHALEPKATRMMNELARWFKNRAEHGEAEPLMRRALAIDENNFGSEHPDVARDLNNLALLLRETNRFTEAESLMRRALAIAQKNFGPDHPNVAICFNNLAELFHETNQLAKAEPLYRRALAIDEKSFGPDHPNVAIRLNNLAELLHETNRFTEAEPVYWRALAIDEKSFGPDHPDVAIDLNNLARLLSHISRLAEAEPLSRRHLRIFAEFGRRTGDEHPHLRAAINNYAELLVAMGLSKDEIAERVRSAIEASPWESA